VPSIVAKHAQTGAVVVHEGALPTADLAGLLGLSAPAAPAEPATK
jgi:thiol:disulfide interchange protein DsbG